MSDVPYKNIRKIGNIFIDIIVYHVGYLKLRYDIQVRIGIWSYELVRWTFEALCSGMSKDILVIIEKAILVDA